MISNVHALFVETNYGHLLKCTENNMDKWGHLHYPAFSTQNLPTSN